MKNSGSKAAPILLAIYRFLLVLILCLALVFAAGTVYSLLVRREAAVPAANPQDRIFTGIGRMRLPTADSRFAPDQGPVVILSITFPYAPEDRAFSEELAARVKEFRSGAEEYFLSFRAEEIANMSEERIKTDLLDRFNRILRLGKIETLYFNDYLMLE